MRLTNNWNPYYLFLTEEGNIGFSNRGPSCSYWVTIFKIKLIPSKLIEVIITHKYKLQYWSEYKVDLTLFKEMYGSIPQMFT